MLILALGLALFAIVHFVPSMMPGLKAAWLNKMGEGGYKGSFSLLLLLAFVLIIVGWRSTTPQFVYAPAAAAWIPALILIGLAFLLQVISARPSRARRWIRHPQLAGVFLWATGHLMLNGDDRTLLLFGTMAIWAFVEMAAINRREGIWVREEPPTLGGEVFNLLLAGVVIAVIIGLHPYIAGRPVF